MAMLTLLGGLFPAEGIGIGNLQLRFASLHSIVENRRLMAAEHVADTAAAPKKATLTDSLAYYHTLVDSSNLRFWLPDSHYFDSFWRDIETAKSQRRTVRILHYGDSQIEMDHITSRLRAYMQRNYGGGGPGMLPFHPTTPNMTISQSNHGDLIHLASFGDSMAVRSRGNYGIMMQCFRLDSGDASVTVKASSSNRVDDATKGFSQIKLIANNHNGLYADFTNLKRKREGGSSKTASSGVSAMEWRTDTLTNAIRVNVSGNADLYALVVDADSGGVAVDNIPMRGCSGQQFTLTNKRLLTEAYATLDVGMIILQFGGNTVPYIKNSEIISDYCRSIGRQIDHLHQCCPDAKILFIGPSDMSHRVKGETKTYDAIPELIDSLIATVNAHDAAYWSIYHAMGGWGSMPTWTRQGLAGKDYIHFSQKGADLMGDYLAQAFDNSHVLYQLEQRWEQQKPKPAPPKVQKAKRHKRKRGGRR